MDPLGAPTHSRKSITTAAPVSGSSAAPGDLAGRAEHGSAPGDLTAGMPVVEDTLQWVFVDAAAVVGTKGRVEGHLEQGRHVREPRPGPRQPLLLNRAQSFRTCPATTQPKVGAGR